MKNILNLILIPMMLVTSFSAPIAKQDAPKLDIRSETAVLMDAETGTVLYGKEAFEKRYPASITKIMTVMLALENLELDQMITVNQSAIDAVERGSSHIYLVENEEISVKDLCYATMLASANDAANVLAEAVSGNIEAFANLMTQKAKQLGTVNTNFKNPSGLPDNEHYTSAYDMALITREAIKNPVFKEIFSTVSYTSDITNKQSEPRIWANGNDMIKVGKVNYEHAVGGKNGWTSFAQYTLVTYAEKDDLSLISVTMKADNKDHYYADHHNLLDFGFNNFKRLIIDKNNIEAQTVEIYHKKQLQAIANFEFTYDLGLLVPNDTQLDAIKYQVEVKNEMDVDNIAAYLNIFINDEFVGRVEMKKDIEVFDIGFKAVTLPKIINVFKYISMAIFALVMLISAKKLIFKK